MGITYLSLFGCCRIDLHLLGLRIFNRVLEFLQARLAQLGGDGSIHIVQPHRHALGGVIGLTQFTLHKDLQNNTHPTPFFLRWACVGIKLG